MLISFGVPHYHLISLFLLRKDVRDWLKLGILPLFFLSRTIYSKEKVLADIRLCFPWLELVNGHQAEVELWEDAIAECTFLVPIERLYLNIMFDLGPYCFIPALGQDNSDEDHPWHEYLSAANITDIWEARKAYDPNNQLGITQEDILLTYPLIEITINIPCGELVKAKQYPDGQIPLLKRCSEIADRGLDILRLEQCSYNQHERLPGIAGQLVSGFHAAYVVPLSNSPFKPKLYNHFASPFQVTPNWLGLDIDFIMEEDPNDLAEIVFGTFTDNMSQRIRGAVRAIGQAFYIVTPEARFLSLIFALDGLCAPTKTWSGLEHHAYIAAIGTGKDVSLFQYWLQVLSSAYSNVRNPIVHRGSSFIELGISPESLSNEMMRLIYNCIGTILYLQVKTEDAIRTCIVETLRKDEFQGVLARFIQTSNRDKPNGKQLKMPKWRIRG